MQLGNLTRLRHKTAESVYQFQNPKGVILLYMLNEFPLSFKLFIYH